MSRRSMDREEKEDTGTYVVVVNHEEQFALWPDGKEIPKGWRSAGKSGAKADCLTYVKSVWTDMTPASLRGRGGSRTTGG
jgi:MbtH protein